MDNLSNLHGAGRLSVATERNGRDRLAKIDLVGDGSEIWRGGCAGSDERAGLMSAAV